MRNVTIAEFANEKGLAEITVRRWIKKGKIEAFKSENKWLIKDDQVSSEVIKFPVDDQGDDQGDDQSRLIITLEQTSVLQVKEIELQSKTIKALEDAIEIQKLGNSGLHTLLNARQEQIEELKSRLEKAERPFHQKLFDFLGFTN
jgi:predicted RNase H-like nuclease (RuvC/YqgF family)